MLSKDVVYIVGLIHNALSRFIPTFVSMKTDYRKKLEKMRKWKPQKVDEAFRGLHEKVFAETDCLTCANCCRTTSPIFTDRDIERIAKHFKMRQAELVHTYLRMDEDGDYVYKSPPCPFILEDNRCSIYDVRPRACAEYPHTDRKDMTKIFGLTLKNALICPAVARILEEIEI